MVPEVGLGHVGLILAIETPRLACSSADWRRLPVPPAVLLDRKDPSSMTKEGFDVKSRVPPNPDRPL